MLISRDQRHEVVVLALDGDLDGSVVDEVTGRITEEVVPGVRLVVDLTGVSYMSSAGLRTMLLLYRWVQCVDGRVALVGVSAQLHSVMSVTGFADAFVFRDTVADAVTAVRRREGGPT
ncbi:MAG: STAS domain-containing protein [Kineosporiaceae bacterium]